MTKILTFFYKKVKNIDVKNKFLTKKLKNIDLKDQNTKIWTNFDYLNHNFDKL